MRWFMPLFLCLTTSAAVTHVHVKERSDVLGGKEFGTAGAYERITATVYFAVDPKLPQNRAIRDIDLAPRNADGLVEFSADVDVLRPRDVSKGNGTLLMEVPNRGGKGMLARFNLAQGSLDPQTPAHFGDGWLLEQGYTLAWLGWQWDVPQKPGLLRLYAPIAKNAAGNPPVTGLVRSEYIPSRSGEKTMPLGDRDHMPYTPLESSMSKAKLAVRSNPGEAPRVLPESAWRWTPGRDAIEVEAGLEPGLLYEFTYEAQDPPLVGLGLAAFRDFASWARLDGSGIHVLGDMNGKLKRSLAFGISQSGRFLRTFLYYGFNEDEKGRKVFDGIWADVAGAGRGSFNHRFAQASRDGYPWFNVFYPTDLFPFTDSTQVDPAAGGADGLLARVKPATVPRIFYTNNSSEYWGRAASLIHTSPDGAADVAPPASTRIYFWAGTQHGPGAIRPKPQANALNGNPLDQRPFQRATLAALHAWVRDGQEPPPSRYPSLAAGELAPASRIALPKWLGVKPPEPRPARRLDFGPMFQAQGLITQEPPAVRGEYPVLLPVPDEDGIDRGGIRLPQAAVPLGAFLGWNTRSASVGNAGRISSLEGSFVPLARDEILRRYADRTKYLERIAAETDRLIADRRLLPADKSLVLEQAAALWDHLMKQN